MFVLPAIGLASINSCASPQEITSALTESTANGCSAVNEKFVNFNVSAPSGNGDTSLPPATGGASSSIEFTTAGTEVAQLAFRTVDETTGTGTNTTCATDSWCEKGSMTTAETASQSFTFAVQAASASGDLYGIALSGPSVEADNQVPGDTIAIKEAFCLGVTSFSCTPASSNYGYVEIVETSTGTGFTTQDTVCSPTLGGCTGTNSSSAFLSFAGQTAIAVQETISLDAVVGCDDTLALNSFDAEFYEAPEPSTLLLLGSAMAGLVILRRRKRA